MKVIICGDRNWTDYKMIEAFIVTLPKDTIIIEGDCKETDQLSGLIGKKYGYEVISVPAEWKKYGRKAGPIRNQEILDEYKPDLVVAFHNDIEHSKGTKNMIDLAIKAGVHVELKGDKY